MARVTVEDCVLKIPNRFDLVMLAAQRARDIASGAVLSVERDNDKNPVVALREIADETIGLQELGEALITGMQKHVESDEPDEDAPEFDVPSIPGMAMGEAVEGLSEVLVAEAPTDVTANAGDDLGEVAAGDLKQPADVPGDENVPVDEDKETV